MLPRCAPSYAVLRWSVSPGHCFSGRRPETSGLKIVGIDVPIAFLGIANLPFGLYGAAVLITVPQVLASEHVPQPLIASITAAAMIPTFCGFLLAPILDVRFSRRSYALVFGILTAIAAWLALLNMAEPSALGAGLIIGFLFANML